ncbi:MAG: DUF4126 domain-containing protein [Verrucomicrobiota bacterium]
MENALSICIGIGLSAACGFRVFVPLLVISMASLSGHLTLSPGFAWIGTYPALTAFAVATALEVGGYFIPWLDHALDTMATPASIVAGTIVTASMITDMSPMMKWTLAVIAGGGAAGLVQGSTVVLRGLSTGLTGGLGNPLFATAELGGALLTSLLALVAPLATLLLLGFVVVILAKKLLRRSPPEIPANPPTNY